MGNNALSKTNNDYSFLKGSEAATLTTPLESESSKIDGFARFNTGAIRLDITPAMVEQCSGLRALQITAEFKRLASVIAQLQASFEINGQIIGIVDPALIAQELPYVDSLEDFSDDMKERSMMPVEYMDSTPTIQGVPVWDRLPGERIDFFNIFKLYRDSRYRLIETGEYLVINRTLAGLARQLCLPGSVLTYISKLYNWKARCTLFDQFMELEIQKRRTQNEVLLRNDHLQVAQKLCSKAYAYLEKNFAKLNPKEVIQTLELGIKYSRISMGLLPDKPGATVAGNQTNLSIYNNTTNNTADKLLNVNAGITTTEQGVGSAVQRQLQQDMKDENNLLSILHVLQASGAMATAVNQDLEKDKVAHTQAIIDVEEDEE